MVKRRKEMKIKKDKGSITIELNKSFYDITAIKETMKDFSNVCSGTIKNKKNIIVTLKPKRKDIVDVIGHEFCNYVLALMKNKTLV